MKTILLLCSILCAASAVDSLAQDNDRCKPPSARAYLNAGNVHAEIGLGGMPIWPGKVAYEVPKNSGHFGLTCMMTWFGGLVEGEPRIAANRELWAGPLDDHGNPSGDCTVYDRIYEITRQDIERFNRSGETTTNLLDWPWHLGAPVLDGDGIESNYNLDGGDRPALLGDQMFWWIMNDAGGEHQQTQSPPIRMEVHATAFVYNKPSGPIGNTTFFRYKLVYKGEAPLEDAYFSLFPETDLGSKYDNFMGADTTLHMVYVYNADNFDGDDGTPRKGEAYGENPPALGIVFLPPPNDGPEAARQKHSSDDDGAFAGLSGFVTEPRHRQNALHYYNLMRGLQYDGQPFTYGSNGHDFSDTPTTIFYPGDPVTGEFWSQMNMDNQGTLGYMTYETVISTGPFSMQPGDEHEIAFAIVWARGDDHLDSVRKLKHNVARLHRYADFFLTPTADLLDTSLPKQSDPFGFAQNYPNPFSISTTIRYSLPQPMRVRLRVYNVLGRVVATLVDEQQDGGIYEAPFEAKNLPGGVYFYQIEMDHLRFTKPMMLIP